MIGFFRRLIAAPTYPDPEQQRRAGLLNFIVWAGYLVVIPYSVLAFFVVPDVVTTIVVMGPVLALVVGLHWLNASGRVQAAGWFLTVTLLLLTLVGTAAYGLLPDSPLMTTLIVTVAIASLLVSGRVGIGVAVIGSVALIIMLILDNLGMMPEPLIETPRIQVVVGTLVSFFMTAVVLSAAATSLQRAYETVRVNEVALRESNTELQSARQDLERRVNERTSALARRADQLRAAAEIGRAASETNDLNALLPLVTKLVSESLGVYHTGIFLLDDSREYAELRAANSPGGQRMLARRHRLKIGAQGIVGYVTDVGLPRIALDVGEDAVFFNNPDLPETHSEVALPLMVRGEIIGALDVQSTKPNAFSDDDVEVLAVLADQIAMAISNARLFDEVQARLDAERRAYGEISQRDWRALLQTRTDWGYQYNNGRVAASHGEWPPHLQHVLNTGQSLHFDDDLGPLFAIPLRVRGQVVGALSFQKPDGSIAWQPDEVELLSTIVDQIGSALESARLYDETQRRAARERAVSAISGRIRETLDIETMLRTAVEEVRQTLNLPTVTIQMTTPDRLNTSATVSDDHA